MEKMKLLYVLINYILDNVLEESLFKISSKYLVFLISLRWEFGISYPIPGYVPVHIYIGSSLDLAEY